VPDPPRLLVGLKARASVDLQVPQILPEVTWNYLERTESGDRSRAEAMLIGSLTREMGSFDPAHAPLLRFVQTIYTGVDPTTFDRFGPSVQVAGNVGGFAPFVSEHAVTLALAAARNLRGAGKMVESGRLRPAPDHRLMWGRTAVILGYGEIGRSIATRLRPFGMRIVGLTALVGWLRGATRCTPRTASRRRSRRGTSCSRPAR